MKLHRNHAGRGSIFFKLLSGYLAVTLVIILLTGVVSYVLLRANLIENNKRDLLNKAETLTKMAQRPGGFSRVLDLPRIGEIQSLTDAQVIYIDSQMQARQIPDGRRPDLISQGEPQDFQLLDVIDSLDQQLLKSLLDGNTAVDVRKLDFMQDQMMFAGAPVKDSSGATKGALLLCRPLREVSAASQSVIQLMAIAFLIAGAIASAIAYVFSRRITRPLTALNRTAARMAEGFYGERVGITQNDEIGQLGTTLNLLSGRLSTVINNLSEEKSKLEKVLTSIGEGIIAVDRQGRRGASQPGGAAASVDAAQVGPAGYQAEADRNAEEGLRWRRAGGEPLQGAGSHRGGRRLPHPRRGRWRDHRRGVPAARHLRSRAIGADAKGLHRQRLP